MREMVAVHAQQQATIEKQQATIDQQQATIDEQQRGLKSFERDLALLKRALFGQRRERFEDPGQGLLFDFAEIGPLATEDSPSDSDEAIAEPSSRRRRGRRRRVIPEGLPREQRVQELKEEDIPEHLRGRPGRRFLKKTSEWIEWEPPRLFVVEEFVETFAVDNEDATQTQMVSAPRPPRIINCFAGPSLLADLAVGHFADHQPYYRREEILARSGLVIDRATQCRWMIRLAKALTPLTDWMRHLALLSPVVQADETPVKMLLPGQGKTSTTYLWAVLGDRRYPYTTFSFTESRARAGPARFFADFRGILVSDAYVGYEFLHPHTQGRIRLAGCHAHARRKFEELHALGPTERTATALGYFQRLFDTEDQLGALSDEDRHNQRQLRSRGLLEEFKRWLEDQLAALRPKHELRGAISYMTTRWECFERFLESGAIPIHNNASEQAVKNPVMGKKAWLFFGSPQGGEAAAVLFTLTATCRRLQIDPQAYLRDVFERLPLLMQSVDDVQNPTALAPLLPDRWLAEHPESRLQMRVDEASDKAARKRARRTRRRKALARRKRR
jgi:hypothetical protein